MKIICFHACQIHSQATRLLSTQERPPCNYRRVARKIELVTLRPCQWWKHVWPWNVQNVDCQNSFNPCISYVPFSGRIVDTLLELFIPLWKGWKFVAYRSTSPVLLLEVHCPRRILRLQCSDVHRKWLVHPSESKKSYAFFRIQTCTLRYLLWSRETSGSSLVIQVKNFTLFCLP